MLKSIKHHIHSKIKKHLKIRKTAMEPQNPAKTNIIKDNKTIIIASLLTVLLLTAGFALWKSGLLSGELTKQPYIPCPTLGSLCQNTNSFKNGSLVIQATRELPLVAVFDGQIKAYDYTSLSPKDPFSLLLLTDQNNTYQAVYQVREKIGQIKEQTKAGQQITDTNNRPVIIKNNSSFSFSMKQLDSTTEPVPLEAANFKP